MNYFSLKIILEAYFKSLSCPLKDSKQQYAPSVPANLNTINCNGFFSKKLDFGFFVLGCEAFCFVFGLRSLILSEKL